MLATVCLHLPCIYKVVMTSLQSSTKAANRLPKNSRTLLFLCLIANFSFRCLFFSCPGIVNGASNEYTVRISVPGCVMKGELVAGGKPRERIMHCLNTHGLIPAGEWLHWAITASARQHWIVLLFWQRSSEGVSHNEFLLIFLVMSSNCMWLESWLLFSHLLPEVPLY